MDAFDLGWLAGIIDGEGTVSLYKGKVVRKDGKIGRQWIPTLRIYNDDPKIMDRIAEIIGPVAISKRVARKPTQRASYEAIFNANTLRKLLPALRLVGKDKQRILLLEALSLLADHKPGFTPHDHRLNEIYRELLSLNHKGPRVRLLANMKRGS